MNLQFFGGRGAASPVFAGGSAGGSGGATSDEIDALEWYVSGEGMFINNVLRGINPELTENDLTPQEKEALKNLDNLTNRETVGERTLYRTVDAQAIFKGITDGEYEALRNVVVYGDTQKYFQAQAGKAMGKMAKSYTEKGLMSTTKDSSIAEDNAYFFGSDKPIILEVKTSKKTKGIDVNKHANKRMREVEKDDPQKEVLLARNQKWNVNAKLSKTDNGFIKVTVISE